MNRRMPRPEGSEYHTTAWTVTARQKHWCEYYRCSNRIRPGEQYARAVVFPGHDVVGGDRPWVMKLCRSCATRYGQPMPPTQAERRAGLVPEREPDGCGCVRAG